MFTTKEQHELNKDAVDGIFRDFGEYFSCFRIQGEKGLMEKMAAHYRTERHGEAELDQLAETLVSEREWLAGIRLNPDLPFPNSEDKYVKAARRFVLQSFLDLMERGAIEDLKLIDGEFPAIAQQQFDALVAEARATPQRQVSPAEKKAAVDAELKLFADRYTRERSDNLRPKAGAVVLDGETMPWNEFQSKLNQAVEAGLL
jgi:hypothetical protein